MGGNAEVMLNVEDVLKIADDYLGWMDNWVNISKLTAETEAPAESHMVEKAKSLGAEVTAVTEIGDDVPNLYTKKDVVEYLTQEQGMTIEQMTKLLNDAGYHDSTEYYVKNGDTPKSHTNLAKSILRLKKVQDSNSSGNLPW